MAARFSLSSKQSCSKHVRCVVGALSAVLMLLSAILSGCSVGSGSANPSPIQTVTEASATPKPTPEVAPTPTYTPEPTPEPTPQRDPVPIVFTNEVFENAVRRALGIYDRDITDVEAESVTELDLSAIEDMTTMGSYIYNIEDIVFFPNLLTLNLANNHIFDVEPLTALTKLEKLDISNNYLQNFAPLAKLTTLKELSIAENGYYFWRSYGVKELAALKNLENLSMYGLYTSTNYGNFDFIASLTKLKKLDIGRNYLHTCSFLQGLTQLESLSLEDNEGPIEGFTSIIEQLKNLKELRVYDADISDSSAYLKSLTGLEKLKIGGSSVYATYSLPYIAEMKGLTSLEIDALGSVDMNLISSLTNLKTLSLKCDGIANAQSISKLTSLEKLMFSPDQIPLNCIATLVNIKELEFDGFSETTADLLYLTSMQKLESLVMWWGEIINISALQQLPNLSKLQIFVD